MYKLNDDFGLAGMIAQNLQAVVAASQARAISKDTIFETRTIPRVEGELINLELSLGEVRLTRTGWLTKLLSDDQ